MKKLLLGCLLSLFCQAAVAQMSDSLFSTPPLVAKASLKALEGPMGAKRDWATFQSLFAKEARMCLMTKSAEGVEVVRYLTMEEFMEKAGANYRKKGFYEYEITPPVVRQYGHMATVWQPYAIKFDPDGEEIMRGINVYHMTKVDGRWLIVFLTWQQQTAEAPVTDWQEAQTGQ